MTLGFLLCVIWLVLMIEDLLFDTPLLILVLILIDSMALAKLMYGRSALVVWKQLCTKEVNLNITRNIMTKMQSNCMLHMEDYLSGERLDGFFLCLVFLLVVGFCNMAWKSLTSSPRGIIIKTMYVSPKQTLTSDLCAYLSFSNVNHDRWLCMNHGVPYNVHN